MKKAEPLAFTLSTGGDALYRGQWDGWVVARVQGDIVGRLDYRTYRSCEGVDEGEVCPEKVDVKHVEVIQAYRRRGVATSMYRKMFEETRLGPGDIGAMMLTPEGQKFRTGVKFNPSSSQALKRLKRKLMR